MSCLFEKFEYLESFIVSISGPVTAVAISIQNEVFWASSLGANNIEINTHSNSNIEREKLHDDFHVTFMSDSLKKFCFAQRADRSLACIKNLITSIIMHTDP